MATDLFTETVEISKPEEWRQVPGYEGFYEASSHGRLRHAATFPYKRDAGKIINGCLDYNGGYLRTSFTRNGERRIVSFHQIICRTFHGDPGPVPEGVDHWEVRHLNGNPQGNRPENLYWGTSKQNAADRERHGRTQKGSIHYRAKLTEESACDAIRMIASGMERKDVAAKFGVSPYTIRTLAQGRDWKHAVVVDRSILPGRSYKTQARGESSGVSKATADIVRQIRAIYAAGERSQDSIAKEFGLAQSAVSSIILRQTWKHVS